MECREGIPWLDTAGEPEDSLSPGPPAGTPFVHRFRTRRNCYLYDVNTMDILRVDPVIWEIVAEVGARSEEEIRACYGARRGDRVIGHALEEIRRAREERGLLLAKRPMVVFPLTVEDIRKRLAHSRTLLILSITEDCNFRCAYCVYSGHYAHRHQWSRRTMSWDVAGRAIAEYIAHRDPRRTAIGFYGGEPLLHLPLLKRCVHYARSLLAPHEEIRFSVTTNGSLLRGEAADFLAREDFRLLVSLDGPCDIHDRYRRFATGLPTWRTVVDNLQVFLRRYPRYQEGTRLMFSCVFAPPLDITNVEAFFQTGGLFGPFVPAVQAGRVDQLANTLGLPGNITGADAIYERYLDNLAHGRITASTLDDAAYRFQRGLFELAYVKFHQRQQRYGCAVHRRRCLPDRFCALSTCLCGGRRLYVSVDGAYWPCERVCESEYLRIGDAWHGLDACKVHQLLCDWVDLNRDECLRCWCLPTCQVGCWQNVCDGARPTARGKKAACAAHRREMHRLLTDYCSLLEVNPHAFDFAANVELA